MKKNTNFEVVDIAGDYIAVPLNSMSDTFKGVVVLNEAAAFMLRNMGDSATIEDLVSLLKEEYEVDDDLLYRDVVELTSSLLDIGLITEK